MTLDDVVRLWQAIHAVSARPLHPRVAYAMSQNRRLIQPIIESYNEVVALMPSTANEYNAAREAIFTRRVQSERAETAAQVNAIMGDEESVSRELTELDAKMAEGKRLLEEYGEKLADLRRCVVDPPLHLAKAPVSLVGSFPLPLIEDLFVMLVDDYAKTSAG